MASFLRTFFSYILIAPAVLPLVYVSALVFPYIAIKVFLLWTLGIVASAIFVYLAFSGSVFYYVRLRNRISWIPIALLVVAYITSLVGIDFYRSFWGVLSRGDGLFTLTVITALFYLTLLSADRVFVDRLVKTVAVVAGLVASIGILQWIESLVGAQLSFLPPATDRVGSTFGNAAFLAGYLGMTFFLSLKAYRDATGLWKNIYKGVAILSVVAVFATATRGSVLALLVSGIAFLLYLARSEHSTIRRQARYALFIVAVLGSLFFVFRSSFIDSPLDSVRRIASISLSDATVSSRLFVWSNVLTEALQKPLSGYGAEHIAQVFDRVYDPGKITEQWFDRSHNSFLDYLVQYGVFGLALYGTLLLAIAVSALRLYRIDRPEGVLFLLLLLTYVVQNFFVFDTPHSLWLLYVVFAILSVKLSDATPTSISEVSWAGMVGGAALLVTLVPTVVFPFYANLLLTKGYVLQIRDVTTATAYFEKGLSLGTYADLEYGYQAYDMYTDHQAVQLTGNDRVVAYQYALKVLSTNYAKYVYDARTATYLGHVLDTAPPEVMVDDVFDAQVLTRAMTLSPLRAQAWYMMANISLRQANVFPVGSREREGHYREAIKVLEMYVEKEPTLSVPRYILATLYYVLDDTTTAKKWADSALSFYIANDPDIAAARPAVKYYLAVHDWQNAVRFLSDIINLEPLNYNVLYDLAKVMYLAGDPATALRIVEELRKNNPTILPTDQNFFTAITAYEQSQK